MFSSIFDPFITAAYTVVNSLAQLMAPIAGAASTAMAIVLFTMAIRALLHPLVRAQVRGEKVRATIAPKVATLREKYRNNPQRLNKELAELYQSEGSTMLAGCLPMLIQLPFFSIMYQLFLHSTVNGQPNELLTHTLLGTGLDQTLFSAPNIFVHLGLFALMAAVATWSSIRARRQMQTVEQSGTVTVLARFLPYLSLIFAAFIPLAAAIYLCTTTTWTAIERTVLTMRANRDAD